MPVEIGHSLRHAREAQGLSLEDVARYTGIPLEHLVAIEEGRLHDLPSPFYARSFLRRYANCVGVRSDIILQRYRAIERGVSPGHSTIPTVGVPTQPTERRRTQRALRRDEPTEIEPSEAKRVFPPTRVQERRVASRLEAASHLEEDREERVEDNTSSSFRRVSLPPDMPDPQEIGLPPRASGKPAQQEVQTAEDQEMESVTLRRSRRRKKQEKEEESTFGIWYTRFLIVGGVLLVLASIGLIILKLVDDKPVVGKYLEERVMSYIYSEEPDLRL